MSSHLPGAGASSSDGLLAATTSALAHSDVRAAAAAAGAAAGQLAAAAGLGPWMRSSLFASTAGAVSRVHYDHYDNIYLQLAGRKCAQSPQL